MSAAPLPGFNSMASTAILSADRRFRYLLGRRWGPGNTMTFVMLNPSIADESLDDQTIRRCIGYAKRANLDAIAVVNLFAYRTPYPADLIDAMQAGCDIVGPENAHHVRTTLERSSVVVCGWGSSIARMPRSPIHDLLRNYPLHCVGRTADGYPRHPSRGEYRDLEPFGPVDTPGDAQ